MGTNFACMELSTMINSAIVSLDSNIGRALAEKIFEEVKAHFDGTSWCGNGPEVLSSMVKKMCKTDDRLRMRRDKCQGFEVLPYEDCYSINSGEWKMFFEEKDLEETLIRTDDSFAIHFWNYITGGEKLKTTSKAAYINFAKQYCPKVFAASGTEF